MRYFNEFDIEIQEDDIDLNLGYLTDDIIVVGKIPAKEEILETYHYVPKNIYFKDGTYLSNIETSEYIIVIDDQAGVFGWDTEKDPEHREYSGMDVFKVIDTIYSPACPETDDIESIKRYILYTEDELNEIAEKKAIEDRNNEVLESTLDRFEINEESILEIADLSASNLDRIEELENAILELASLIGGE